MSESGAGPRLDRRGFMSGAALGGAALAGGLAAAAPALAQGASIARPSGAPQVDFPEDPRAFGGGPPSARNRTEMDLRDCEVEGDWPIDLDGAFYR
ncbi:MAG: hypothetical protein N2Z59_00155, partial [Alteraurantiacibacter sp.]|nr:hypothetical protein [Alteraurantiacibacter sp.]